MNSKPDDEDHSKKDGGEDYSESAKREWMYTNWIDLYFDMAFRPFETTQKVAELMWEAHGRQQKDAMEYLHEAENKVWGPNRKLIQEVAYFMWDMAGKQPEMATSFWVAAQKYVASLMALATKVSTSADNLMSVFSPATYFHRVQDLAQTMCRRTGQQAMVPALAFWLSAENHILTMVAGVATAVDTLQDAVTYLDTVSGLSSEKYLRYIQKDAYYRWVRVGKPFGKQLAHWIESEEEILARIRERIGSSPFDQLSRSE